MDRHRILTKHSTSSYGKGAQKLYLLPKIAEIAVSCILINYNSGMLGLCMFVMALVSDMNNCIK